MKINKHIQGLAQELDLAEWEVNRLQHVWNNRNKPRSIVLVLMKVTSSGMSRQFKVGTVMNGEFVDLTMIVSKVTGKKYNYDNHTVVIGGGGMDMGFALLDRFYSRLIPKNSKAKSYQLKAVSAHNF